MASRGYHGATTREIADRVGIRQPSLFNHFASKQAILEELLFYDLTVPADTAEEMATGDEASAVRLLRYAIWDWSWYQDMPLDLRGLHEDLVALPSLSPFQADLQRWGRAIQQILDQGLAAGEFLPDATPYVPAILDTLSWEFVKSSHHQVTGRPPLKTEEAASFVMRGLLTDPAALPELLRHAQQTPELAR